MIYRCPLFVSNNARIKNTLNIIPFQFESNNIRVIEQDGEPWFVAKDVAELLGYKHPRSAISRHCNLVLRYPMHSSGGIQETTIIPESDVYRLIIRSKLPSAKRFERWLVDEVFPTFRKEAGYGFNPQSLSRMELIKLVNKVEEENQRLKAMLAARSSRLDVYHHMPDVDCLEIH